MSGDGGGSSIVRMIAKVTAVCVGGSVAAGFLTSSVLHFSSLHSKKKRNGGLCRKCKGVGFYACKLCKGNGTIEWSPLYDPVFINPCVCPTCDGFKVQKCLNCLGDGSVW